MGSGAKTFETNVRRLFSVAVPKEFQAAVSVRGVGLGWVVGPKHLRQMFDKCSTAGSIVLSVLDGSTRLRKGVLNRIGLGTPVPADRQEVLVPK